jgi:hypothetical protein
MVWAATVFGRPGQQHADARYVHALLALGHGAADDGVVDARKVDARRLRDNALEHVRQHFVRARVAEDTSGRFPDGRAGRGDDIGVLDLLAHACLPSR